MPIALDSVLNQTYQNWEAIVVNDGSTDNTISVMEQYAAKDSRIKIYSKLNGGTGSALNECLKHSSGNWICWLSSDDLFDKDKLKNHYNEIQKAPNIKFFYSHYYVLDDSKQVIYAPDYSAQTRFYISPYQMLGFFDGNYINGLSIAIHKSVFEEVGVFNENIRYAQDYDMWLRIVAKYEARYIDFRTIITRVYPDQITTAHPEWGILDSTRAAIDFINNYKFADYFPRLPLNRLDNIIYAIEQTIYLSLNKEIFLYKGHFFPALLERLHEWLFWDCPKGFRSEIQGRINIILDKITELKLAENLPQIIKNALQNLRNATIVEYNYKKHNFFDEIIEANKNGKNKEIIDLYIRKTNPKKIVDFNISEYLPKIQFPEIKLNGTEAKVEFSKLIFDESTVRIQFLISSENNKNYKIEKEVDISEKFTSFNFDDPITKQPKFISAKTILNQFTNNYSFEDAFEFVSKIVNNGQKPTIAFSILDSEIKGGGTIVIYNFANWLHQKGFEVTIYSNKSKPNWVELNVNFVEIEDSIKRYSEIKENILFIYSISEVPILTRFLKKSNILLFHICQGVETHHFGQTIQELLSEKWYFDLLHAVQVGRITISNSLNNYFLDRFGQKTIQITNGISHKYIEREIKPKNFKEKKINILFVGNPNFILKNFLTIIKSLALLNEKYAKYEFLLTIIDGSFNGLKTSEQIQGIQINYFSCPTIECMINQYQKSHIYINSSVYEGFGLPTLEAMACGTPVIQANNSGLDGIVEDNENCLMFNPMDEVELSDKIFEIINNAELRNKLIENGKKTAVKYSLIAQRIDFDRKIDGLINALKNFKKKPILDSVNFNILLEIKQKTNKSQKEKIDIIFLTHNRLNYFVQTIEALIQNTRFPYRIIVVDNKSDDEFREFLKSTSQLFDKIILLDENQWTKSFQIGINQSEGQYFVVSDPDILVPNLEGKCWLERLYDLHLQNPEMGLIALNLDSSNKPEKMEDVYLGKKENYNDEIILSNVGTVMQMINRKYFNFNYITDWETCERIRRNGGKVGFAKNIIAYHLGWNEDNDYPEYLVDKYNFFKQNYKVETYKLYTTKKELIDKMEKNETNTYYSNSRPEVQKLVSNSSKKILDVGCAEGIMASELKLRNQAEVWGIEIEKEIAERAKTKIDKVLVGSVESQIENLPDNFFNSIIFADVLEHLVHPDEVLKSVKSKLVNDGEIIISIPNVRHWTVIFSLLQGTFNYEELGVFDKTHLRFFTLETATKMIIDAGFDIIDINVTKIQVITFPETLITELTKFGLKINDLNERMNHYQYLIKVKKQSNKQKVSIIIPVYNQIKYTLETIRSIYQFTKEDFELILVDNASEKETQVQLEKISTEYQNVKIIRNDINYGFPSAINIGIKNSVGKYIVVMNNDVVVTENWLTKMLAIAESKDEIGIVGPISNHVSGVQIDKNTKYNSIEEMHKYAQTISELNKNSTLEFPRVVFFCTLIKRSVLDKIGGLDERFYPGNFEDDDFCLRAQIAGFKSVIARDVFIHHFGSKSFTADGNEKYAKLLETNKRKFIEKWGSTPDEIWLENKSIIRSDFYSPIFSDFERNFMIGNQLIQKLEFSKALPFFEKSIEFFNPHIGISLQKIVEITAKIASEEKQFEKSLKLIEDFLKKEPKSVQMLVLAGEICEKKDDYNQAVLYYKKAENLEKSDLIKSRLKNIYKKISQEEK